MSVLLLGGAGYIGTQLAKRYLLDNNNVNVVDMLMYENYNSIIKDNSYYRFINDDILNVEKYFSDQSHYETIIYMASPRLRDLKDESRIEEELDRLDKVIKIVKKYENDSTKFLFLSSCSVYGITDDYVNESTEPIETSLYSKLKILAEKRVLQENERFNVLRLSTVYGYSEFQRDDNLINFLVDSAKKNKKIDIFDPNSSRPHIHLRDVVEMIRHITSRDIRHRIINVGSRDANISKKEIIETIEKVIGNKIDVEYTESKDSRNYKVDFSLLNDEYIDNTDFDYTFSTLRENIYKMYVGGLNFSHEEWDSLLNYWRPNGSSKTWYLEEESKLSIPKMWGDWNIINQETGKIFDNTFLKSTIFPPFKRNLINYLGKKEIKNKKHIYLISIYTPAFFTDNKDIGFDCIDPKFIRDIREGRAKLVMMHYMEGYSGMTGNRDLEIINKWIEKAKIPATSVYYIHGNLKVEEIAKQRNYKFKCIGLSTFDVWLNPNFVPHDSCDFNPESHKYLYLSYNRNQREHRILLQCFLLENDLLDKGLISCGDFDLDKTPHFLELHRLVPSLKEIVPIEIDKPLEINWANDISGEDYHKTFLSLVTETHTDRNILFLSEKIFKPIYMGHPFILLGNPGTLKKLKSMGYKTFDKWWDESYDNEIDLRKRTQMIVSILKSLNEKTRDELIELRNEMKETLNWNQHIYRMSVDEKYRVDGQHFVMEVPILKLMADIYYGKI